MNRLTPLSYLVVCLHAAPAAAQLPAPQYPRAEMSIGFTGMSRGPGEGSEHAMMAMGLNGEYGARMTQTDLEGFWKVEIGTANHRSVGIITTRVRNSSSGSGQIPGGGHVQITTRQAVVTRAVTYSYRPNGWLSFGAGPALHVRRFAINAPVGPNVGVQSKRALGAVAGINVKWKREGGAFAHAMWQYRYAGSLTSDAVSVPVVAGGVAVPSAQWPSTRLPFSHRMLGIGIGLEF